MHKKIVIILFFILFFSTSVPFSFGVQPLQKSGEAFDMPYQAGWPQKTINKIMSKPVVADLDGDGTLEVIVGSGKDGFKNFFVYVFHHSGCIMAGWPKKVSYGMYGSPAVGDIDDDGDLEIVLPDTDKMYAWHHDGTPVDGWPNAIGRCKSTPTLSDLDDDDDLEIIIGTMEKHPSGASFAAVHIWHHDGSYVEGWPQNITTYDYSIVEYGSTAVGDIDNDGTSEIIVGIRLSDDYDPAHGYVYVWHSDGTIMDGWPLPVLGWVQSSPALADLDDDEDLEIILGTFGGKVYVLHHNGTNVVGWPNDLHSWLYDQAVADIDQDGILEIICGTVAYGSVHIWNANGTVLPGWDQDTDGSINDPPVIGDIYGDGRLEVIVSSTDTLVHAWCHNGSQVPGFPLSVGKGVGTTPCLGDLDDDGDVELIVGSTDKRVYVWDLPMPLKEEGMEWPMYQHDLFHTGCYGFGKGFMVDANGPYYARIDHPVEFRGSVVNGDPPYSWQWDFGDGNLSTERNPVHTYDHLGGYLVNLTVCDGSGHCGFDADMVEVSSFGRVEYGAIRIKRIRGGVGVTAVVENKGSVNATDVQVTFTVETLFEMDEGGLIFPLNGERTKCVDIPAGKTRKVHCCIFHNPFFWPIVAYNVDVDVQIENCVDKETRLMIVSSCIVIPEDTPFPFGKYYRLFNK